ncbi:MAG: sugar kinase [Actinomycetota bacterium]|nr:MAG: sugar kinase [Actinomycetota bacterium]
MPRVIVCVAANPSIDKLFEVERLRVGEIHRPVAFVQVPGGKGLNVARAAHALGAEVTATGILAGHAGRWVADALAAEGVRGAFVWAEGETRASLSVADRAGGGLTEFYETGTAVGAEDWGLLEARVAELASSAAWITLSGSVPPGTPEDGYARLVRIGVRAGVPVALDARDDALAGALAEGPSLVKVNAEEAATLLGAPLSTAEEARAAAAEIRARLPRGGAAIVTRGAEGAVAALPDGDVVLGRLYVRGPYPVGSGDAFLGGLVTALERGDGWPEALRLALGAAAANAELPGAGRLDPSRARALAELAELRPS